MSTDPNLLNHRDVHACTAFAKSWRTSDGYGPLPVPVATPTDLALLVADLASLARDLSAEWDKARNGQTRATEDLAMAHQTLRDIEAAIEAAGIAAPGTLADRIRGLAEFHRAAQEASNEKSDRLEVADREIDRLTGQLSDLRGEHVDDLAEINALRANIARLARVVLHLSGAQ